MRHMHAAIALAAALLAAAGEPCAEPRFYERGAEGWFWYNWDPPLERVPLESERNPEPGAQTSPAGAKPDAALDTSTPAPLSAAWLREILPRLRDAALDDPSPARVRAYLYAQRAALDRADRFSKTAVRVAGLDPWLDESLARPMAPFAVHALERSAREATDQALSTIAREAGIFVFYRSDCVYCLIEAPVLDAFARAHGFRVLAISLDGRALPTGHFPDYRIDTGQAEQLGVTVTPTLYLVRPPDRYLPLGQGALTRAELTRSVLAAAAEAGIITPSALRRTRPVQPATPALLTSAATALPDPLADPQAFTRMLRAYALEETGSRETFR